MAEERIDQEIASKGAPPGGLPPEIEHDEAPQDLRSTIKSAFRESEDRDEPEEKEVKEVKEAPKEEKPRRVAKPDKAVDSKGDISKPIQEPVKPEVDKPKVDPPPFWKSKGKAVWDQLTPAAQEAVAQREQEVSKGFAMYGPKVKAFDELMPVIEPHLPAIQRFGATVPQTIERLFGWMQALSHQNDDFRAQAFKSLAQAFNIPLNRLIPTQQQGQQEQQPTNDQPPEWLQQYFSQMDNRVRTAEQQAQYVAAQLHQQTENAATNYLGNWSKDKPHFEAVRTQMKYIFDNNLIPLLDNGALDLDGAYKAAVANNPQVQAQIRAETEAKAKAEADDKAAKDAQLAAARLAKARKAGASIRPAAPTISSPPQGKPNGTGKRGQSVRDSIADAIRQAAE